MSDTNETPTEEVLAVLAEFASADETLAAAEKVRDAGYKRWDVYSPFPIHGIEEAMGVRQTLLPWIVLAGAMAGLTTAIGLQWYTNAVQFAWDYSGYQFLVSGKEFFAIPSAMPVAFELTVLFAAFAAFLGMLAMNGLPRLANPIFASERFRRVTNDRFFIAIEAADKRFDAEEVRSLLGGAGSTATETLHRPAESLAMPTGTWTVVWLLVVFSLIPPLLIARAWNVKGSQPRLHPIFDMDSQQKFKAQNQNTFFEDGRSMRPQIAGTIPRGDLDYEPRVYRGIEEAPLEMTRRARASVPATRNVAFLQEEPQPEAEAADDALEPAPLEAAPLEAAPLEAAPLEPAPMEDEEPAAEADPAADVGAPVDNTPWVQEVPIPVTRALLERGRQQYNIYCAVCHGRLGNGLGPVSRRAEQLQQPNWVKPVSLQEDVVRNQRADGHIYNTITHGIRRMPAYGGQLTVRDRWAIVGYIRALQRSQRATIDDVPEGAKQGLLEQQ